LCWREGRWSCLRGEGGRGGGCLVPNYRDLGSRFTYLITADILTSSHEVWCCHFVTVTVHPQLTRIHHASLHSGYDSQSVTFSGRFYVELVLLPVRFTEGTDIDRRPKPKTYVEKCLPIRRSRERKMAKEIQL